MSEILEVVSTIFITVMLFAGAVLIGMVAVGAGPPLERTQDNI